MTDERRKLNKKCIKILQNTIIKSSDCNKPQQSDIYVNELIDAHYSSSDKENHPNVIKNLPKRRETFSSIVFEEEPIFSDAEEEAEYTKQFLEYQELYNPINETHQSLNQSSCSLTSEELKITEIIKQYADNTDNVSEDFKQLVNVSKQIKLKYSNIGSTSKELTVYNNNEPINYKHCLENMPDLVTTSKNNVDQIWQQNITPSRNGSAEFFSEKLSFDSGITNISSVINLIDNNDNNINTIRKSTRKRKIVIRSSCGVLISKKSAEEIRKKKKVHKKLSENMSSIKITRKKSDKNNKVPGEKSTSSETKLKNSIGKDFTHRTSLLKWTNVKHLNVPSTTSEELTVNSNCEPLNDKHCLHDLPDSGTASLNVVNQFGREKIMPSRNGSREFFSKKISTDSGIANTSSIINLIDNNDDKVKTMRKSGRKTKLVNRSSCGVLISNKSAQEIRKRNQTNKKVTESMLLSKIITKKIINGEQSENEVSDTENKISRKKLTRSAMNSKDGVKKNAEDTRNKKNLSSKIVSKNLRINPKQFKNISIPNALEDKKLSPTSKTIQNDTLVNLFNKNHTKLLPRQKLKVLARNWMKFNKSKKQTETQDNVQGVMRSFVYQSFT